MLLAKKRIFKAISFLIVLSTFPVFAEPPVLQTPSPVIYLADNLDENDSLGWCIDTRGRGFAEELQAHSCKPQGGDVQFSYNEESLQIMSVEFAGKCVSHNDNSDAGTDFKLLDCLSDSQVQRFIYNSSTLRFHFEKDETFCIAVGGTSQAAGPFMSRSLGLAACSETPLELQQWIILKDVQ